MDLNTTILTNEELDLIIEKAAEKAAVKTLKKLKDGGKMKNVDTDSYKKTEELLFLYPKLPENHPVRVKIDKALEKIKSDEYCDVIASRYFDGMSVAEISNIYDCQWRWIAKKKKKLVKILASELFPEEVANEIMEKCDEKD